MNQSQIIYKMPVNANGFLKRVRFINKYVNSSDSNDTRYLFVFLTFNCTDKDQKSYSMSMGSKEPVNDSTLVVQGLCIGARTAVTHVVLHFLSPS